MPPKKKQEQVDVSTLPQCLSLRSRILRMGRVRTSHLSQCIRVITRGEVLEHAKEKAFYTDPNQLTEKQKKDPKAMQGLCTELTASVLARATRSLLTALDTKLRLGKKNPLTTLYDVVYDFIDYPATKEQYQQLNKEGVGLANILVITPKITLPDEDEDEYEAVVKRETLTQQEIEKDSSNRVAIEAIKNIRSLSMELRSITIVNMQFEVDTTSEEHTLAQCAKSFWQQLEKLNAQSQEYEVWKKQRVVKQLHLGKVEKEIHGQGKGISAILTEMLQSIYASPIAESVDLKTALKYSGVQQVEKKEGGIKQWKCQNEHSKTPNLLTIGIDRHQMVPPMLESKRKALCAEYIPLLQDMSVSQFERSKILLHFEQMLSDEESKYNFSDRVFEQHHDADSLRRELQLKWGQDTMSYKYILQEDSVCLALVQKINQRRLAKYHHTMPWRVLPNFENWLQYFKINESNLNQKEYYAIDYELVAPMQENTQSFSVAKGVILRKTLKIGKCLTNVLYCVLNDYVFGVNNEGIYCENITNSNRVRYNVGQHTYTVVIQLAEDKIIVKDGIVYTQSKDSIRGVTADGYSILYSNSGSVKNTVLHPNSSVTVSSDTYTNQLGYGLQQGKLSRVEILSKRTADYTLRKRQDGVTSIDFKEKKWIKFADGTEYLHQNGEIKIEKPNHPYVLCKNGTITVSLNCVQIKVENDKVNISYDDRQKLHLEAGLMRISSLKEEDYFEVDQVKQEIRGYQSKNRVEVSQKHAIYYKGDTALDATQDVFPQEQYTIVQHPRLFYIKNNRGKQLLNQSQMRSYFKKDRIKYDKDNRMHFVSTIDNTKIKHINIGNIYEDVFTHTHTAPSPTPKTYTLRTLLHHSDIVPTASIVRIKAAAEEWGKYLCKEQNEYGYKHDPQSVQKRLKHKLLSLSYRIKAEQPHEQYMSQGIRLYEEQRKQEQNKRKREKQEILRRESYSKKKESYKQQYKTIQLNPNSGEKYLEEEILPQFYPHYFYTIEGKKALQQMPEWVFRPKAESLNETQQQMLQQLSNTLKSNAPKEKEQQEEEEYEEEKRDLVPVPQVLIKASVFTKQQIQEERQAFQEEKKAYKYHESKRKDFDVYGKERKNPILVKSLLRTEPPCEINQKHIITDAAYDKRVKTCSMRNKMSSEATSINQLRREGPHAALTPLGDTAVYLNKRLLMAKTVLTDKLQRDILIIPAKADFGTVQPNKSYVMAIEIKNEDVIPQRIILKRPKTIHARVEISQTGLIAMGITRKIIVTLRTGELGKFNDEFDIVTKHQIYHIPIFAVVGEEGGSLKAGVREEESKKKEGILPPIK